MQLTFEGIAMRVDLRLNLIKLLPQVSEEALRLLDSARA